MISLHFSWLNKRRLPLYLNSTDKEKIIKTNQPCICTLVLSFKANCRIKIMVSKDTCCLCPLWRGNCCSFHRTDHEWIVNQLLGRDERNLINVIMRVNFECEAETYSSCDSNHRRVSLNFVFQCVRAFFISVPVKL